MNMKEFFVMNSLLCLQPFICSAASEPLSRTPQRKALFEVFGEGPHSGKWSKLAGTCYLENLFLLEHELENVFVNHTVRFGDDWSRKRAAKAALLTKTFGKNLSSEDMCTLVGEISLRAYIKEHSRMSSLPQGALTSGQPSESISPQPTRALSEDLSSREVLRSVFGNQGSEKRRKLKGTRFEQNLGCLLGELEQVTVDLEVVSELDWENEKNKKQAYLCATFGECLDIVDIHALLSITKNSFYKERTFQEELVKRLRGVSNLIKNEA